MRRLTLALAVLAGTGAVPATAGAVLPGPNGPLVFTSGRDDGSGLTNEKAQIWFLSGPNGGASRLTTDSALHHRHATWSPDRTKIAYARGAAGFAGPWDIYVQDLTNPAAAPVQITNTSLNEDRPSWSPDGTRLAYAKEVSPGFWDIVTKEPTLASPETTVAVTASAGPGNSGQFSRPQWSPGGETIFYGKVVSTMPGLDYDIYRAPADGSDSIVGGTPVVAGNTHDYQPSLSPDGTKVCFTREFAAGDKDVYVHFIGTMGIPAPLLTGTTTQDYECAWSPDGDTIAFVRGGFGAGHILMKNFGAPVADPPAPVADAPGVFDGNPEWTRNPPPTCSNANASVVFNGFQTIPLSCADDPDPPSYQPSELELQIVTQPANGTLSGIQNNSVIYTPNANFQGNDSFSFTGNDQTTTSPPATITVNVAGPVPDVTAASITDVSVSPLRWRRGPELPTFSASTGTRIQWRLSEAARATLTFQRARPGRRVRGRCVRPTRANRARRRCTRFVSVRPSLTRPNAQAGLNTLRFQGRLSRRKRLPLGIYRVIVGAVDAAGNRSASERSRTFRIVAR